jgi:hypothetical protein
MQIKIVVSLYVVLVDDSNGQEEVFKRSGW